MIRILTLITCLAGPTSAHCNGVSGALCESVAGTSFKLEQDDTILMVNLFPISADAKTITYAACPVVSRQIESEGEATDCHIGVTDRDGDLVSFAPLGTCTAQHAWTPDCPAFTAEGFTLGNRAALESMIAAENLSCSNQTIPRPLAQQIERGGDRGLDSYRTYDFEVVTGCKGIVGDARDICDKLPASNGSLFAFEAAGHTTVCTLGDGNRLTSCRSD